MCYTCGLSCQNCPGHMGHIELALPLFNTVVFPTLYHLLKAVCFNCHRLSVGQSAAELLLAQCKLLDEGLVAEAKELQGLFAEVDKASEKQDKITEIKAFTENAFNDRRNGTIKESGIKNVEAVKQEISKSFMKTHVKHSNKCVYCSTRMPKLRMEYNAKIFVVGESIGSKKNTKNVVSDDEDEDDEDDDDSGGQPKKKKQKLQTVKEIGSKAVDVTLLTPINIRENLRKVWKLESELLKQMYPSLMSTDMEYPTDMFFVEVVAVPPTKFRPISMRYGKKFEHSQTSNLLRVLKCNYIVREILWEMEKASANTQLEEQGKYSRDVSQIPGKTLVDKLSNALAKLQAYANAVIDSDLDKVSDDVNPGIKQVIEKKEGIFRKNMMGKRVNFAARSVISPDPNINTCEIGIPEVFAKVLSYPQPVTPWNVHELRQAVINGPDIHPGATHVVDENGHKTRLDSRYPGKREAIAKQLLTPTMVTEKNPNGVKKVFRHLKNGDVLLINRQPTLHRPSIQAHKARVLKGEKTLRLHYANCKAYNADFDGDEMNAHFPQNEIARSEAYILAITDWQYLVPKDGTPLAGLIQDHMVSGVSLTVRGRFFTKADYCRLVYGALVDKSGPIKMLPPSIIKPVRLWSGKQVLSTVVLNVIPHGQPALSLDGKAKVPEKSWVKVQKGSFGDALKYMTESEDVIIRQGELLCGVLDKGHYGPSNFGLIHCCYELYGGAIAGLMLTCFGRLFMNFLQWRGFTLGVEDILVTKQGDKRRKKLIKKSPTCGEMSAKKALELEPTCDKEELLSALKNAHFSKDERRMRELDMNMRNQTNTIQNDIVNACMPNGLEKLFPDNNLQLMVQSGAKGSMVNCMQISCLLGQIELEGKRPPLMLSGKTLPSFLSYDVTPRAGGFVTGRFLTGIRQQEYFFHCMAGREGLVDTAVKTSRSGYLQRCLIKHLEGIKVNYDLTVRDCDSSVIQFKYGEDSLDISKVGFLIPKQFPFLLSNKHILENKQQKVPFDESEEKRISKLEKKIQKWQKKNNRDGRQLVRRSGFLQFCQDVGDDLDITEDCDTAPGRSDKDWQLCTLWKTISEKQKKKYEKKCVKCPDPVLSKFLPYSPNVLPERLGDIIRNYAKKNTDEEQFSQLMNMKVQQSVIEPGEAVGLLCAQSIGEPSTQMTLNTFHFAGRGEMNVTLGIPRLREILMVGSKNIKTPALDIPVLPGDDIREKVKQLQRRLTKVNLNEVIQNIQVCEWLAIKGKIRAQRSRVFRIRMNFLPRECYKERFVVGPNTILKFVEKTYIKKIVQLVRAKINAQNKLLSSGTQKRRLQPRSTEDSEFSNVGANMDDDEEEAMDADDGDETANNQKHKKMEEHEYDDEDENSRDSFDKEDEEEDVDMEDEVPETEDINEELIAEYEVKDKDHPEARINAVLQLGAEVEHYRYDIKKKLWCEVTISFPLQDSKIDLLALLESDIKKHVVYEVPGISRCILGEQDGPYGKEMHLKTEGINMLELFRNADILDINRLYCNSIHDMAMMYGIEAASRVVIKEVQAVFAAYGINVDYRHLSLLADYMTFEGSYKPFNRVAMETNPSPLQKMSFEQTMKFLVDSSVKCRTDSLKSPSAQIVLGKNVSCGTGCLDLFTPLTF
ncbi:DNA-directed RNA polymerase I subunit RPA1-like [Mercenaria mercenaria]|uniref:DNA-directed RNA polymerase I subunit RPA1-like n=1 Tax=Mercenaria mercenaria TaxID=6596 RepID=UPI00234E6179|nr:DNA-directed RNA polymerase I subunit RPA1-like [Mercenaria mercenaria]